VLEIGDDFTDLLVALRDEDVEFLLVGGWAMAVHGHGRGTDDLDVWVRASPDNAAKVFRALVRFGAPVQAHQVRPEDFAAERYGYRFGQKPQLIEILTTVTGVAFDEAWSQRRTFELEGRKIPCIGRRALLANERAAARPKDLADVDWLEAHPEPD